MKKKGLPAVVLLAMMLVAFPLWAKGPRHLPPGKLIVDCVQEGVTIFIDGKKAGQTPLATPLSLKPGKHQLKATKPGFAMYEVEIDIKSGKTTRLPLDLFPVSGLLKITANVEGAEVYLNNQLKGYTPFIKDVDVGKYQVTLLKEGYNDFVTEVVVDAGGKYVIEGVLTPFRDLSPEVVKLAEEKKRQQEAEKQLAEQLNVPAPPPAEPWYRGLHRKWWFWTAAGVVVAGVIAIPIAATSGSAQANLNLHKPAATIQLPLSR